MAIVVGSGSGGFCWVCAERVKGGLEPMSKSKRTKALEIPKYVKERVFERDGGCCVWCGNIGNPNAHYISRAQGGLGIEENILTLCWPCHLRYDASSDRERMREYFREYLSSKYEGWNESKLIYRRWWQ